MSRPQAVGPLVASTRPNFPGLRAVFVDCFDTLVRRTVAPEDVKRLAGRRLANRLGPDVPEDLPYACRSELERWTAQEAVRAGHDLDVRVDEAFLSAWSEMIGRRLPVGVVLPDAGTFARLALDLEVAVETQVQRVDPETVALLREARAEGCRVHLVSDFYLPAAHLLAMLEHHGLAPLFDTVEVSCDHGRTKASGRLFPHLLGLLGLDASDVLMIGDNPHSDVACAQAAGLRTMYVDRRGETSRWGLSPARADLTPELQGVSGPFRELVHSLLLFIARMDRSLVTSGIREALFLSREGWLLGQLHEAWQDALNRRGDVRIRSRYVHVSRRATLLAACGPLEKERFTTLFRQYRAMSPLQFLQNLGMMPDDAAALLVRAGIRDDGVEADLPSSPVFGRLMASPVFRDWYGQARAEAHGMLLDYLEPDGPGEGPLHLVDIGWKGTIQDQLYRTFAGRRPLVGHYLGLSALGERSDDNAKHGWVFRLEPAVTPGAPLFTDNLALFEMLLGAPHGSVRGYVRGADGRVQAVFEDLDAEQDLYRAVVAPIQQRLLEDFRELASVWARYPGAIEDAQAGVVRRHARMTLFPTREEVDLFASMHHYENFGTFGTSTFRGGANSLRGMAKLLLRGRRFLRSGWWPALTLHQHGLGWLTGPYGRWRLWRTPLGGA